jgi:hypothetical protein
MDSWTSEREVEKPKPPTKTERRAALLQLAQTQASQLKTMADVLEKDFLGLTPAVRYLRSAASLFERILREYRG